MGFRTFVDKTVDTVFIVQNATAGTRQNKDISVFNYPISPGGNRDLMMIPHVSEADIRNSLLKGELKTKLSLGVLTVVRSNIDLLQFDDEQRAFLESVGIVGGITNPASVLAQADWYVDSVNGDDLNTGKTSAAALKTLEELLVKRFGAYPKFSINTVIHLSGNFSDQDFILRGSVDDGVNVALVGEVTIVRSGAITAKTDYVAGTTVAEVTDTGVTDWISDVGDRVKLTSGANSGAMNWVAKDLGGNAARTNTWFTLNAIASSSFTTLSSNTINAAISDTYQIEQLTNLRGLDVHLDRPGTSVNESVVFEARDLNIGASFFGALLSLGNNSALSGCKISGIIHIANTMMVGCYFSAGAVLSGSFGSQVIASVVTSFIISASRFLIGTRSLFQGTGINSSYGVTIQILSDLAVYDAAVPGVSVGTNCVIEKTSGTLFGSGNTNVGVETKATGVFVYNAKPTLSGTSGDTRLAGAITTWAALPVFDSIHASGIIAA